jgi:hypothetical protein
MKIEDIVVVFQKTCGVVICAVVMLGMPSCFSDSYTVKLSDSVVIGDEWVTLTPKVPLKADKTFQWVNLVLEPPLKDDEYNEGKGKDRGKGILMPDGEVINPEIEVVDQHGNTFRFIYQGASGGAPIYGYTDPKELPRDREYKAVRIRSPKPIKCKAVLWFCESSKDWK